MHVWDPQNSWQKLEVFKRHFFAPAVVKQSFFIDPNGITRHKCEILWIIMIACVQDQHAAASVVFVHVIVLIVLAVTLHTLPFLWTYRHCHALTYVMSIGLWLERLFGNMFLHAFQQLSIVPVWASTFGLPLWQRQTIFGNWPLEWFTNYVERSTFRRQPGRQELRQ